MGNHDKCDPAHCQAAALEGYFRWLDRQDQAVEKLRNDLASGNVAPAGEAPPRSETQCP